MEYVKSQDQILNIFTKPLKYQAFIKMRSLLEITKLILRGGVKN